MKNQFMTDEEYERFWFSFEGIRGDIARALLPYGLQKANWILDAPAGHGLFAYEIALQAPRSQVLGLGLWNDVRDFKYTRELERYADGLRAVTYVACDATALPFANASFDFIVNFLGLEDIHMTLGHHGVSQAFEEFARTLRPGGILQIAVNTEGDEPDEVLSKEVTEFIGHNATFKEKDYYINQLESNGFELLEERWEYSQKKLTAQQAAAELQFACEQTLKTFHDFNVTCRSFEEVWKTFGDKIEEIGLAYYSDICVLIGRT